MKTSLTQGSWELGSIMNIPIRIHFSWLLVFGLITWSLSTQYFPSIAPNLPQAAYWTKGLLAALLLFASVAFHELAHSWVAKHYGMTISGITLFIFGGVAELKGEPPHPKAEFWIALAGPLSSFFLAFLFFIFGFYSSNGVQALVTYLAQINLFLGIFNLIPGFPMDGGRILRSALWSKQKDLFSATQKAAAFGRGIGLFFIFFGIFSLFGRMPGGIWLMLIGWFLYSAAQASVQHAALQQSLFGIKVKDILIRQPVSLPSDLSLNEAVNHYFLKEGFGGFPVIEKGRFLGFVTLKEIKKIPRSDWDQVRLAEVVVPYQDKWEISLEDEAIKSLELMIHEDLGRLAVRDKGALVGMITRNGIARYLQMKKVVSGT